MLRSIAGRKCNVFKWGSEIASTSRPLDQYAKRALHFQIAFFVYSDILLRSSTRKLRLRMVENCRMFWIFLISIICKVNLAISRPYLLSIYPRVLKPCSATFKILWSFFENYNYGKYFPKRYCICQRYCMLWNNNKRCYSFTSVDIHHFH